MSKERDLGAVQQFMEKHGMGVDDLFFVLHLGAKGLALKQDVPAPVRAHWKQVSEECHDLWHNTHRSGSSLRQV